MPKWAKIAVYGGAIAVVLDYFIGPAMRKGLNL